ncbi:DUF2877 domain-containing protein [Selenihalanaerobacter shriftii]|uniref:DUF2877 domain-containing protein n=1 Tax=Selenihalanaerobacter shriftii TaxID=142842 RepID=A0A1T4JSW5_9FIRM|nr:DUF2877 domain-containing protein [Selenihalanaerobacter shriftii]SJZ33248.1 Protein of unknown function [Selenihalanaerobacter shriftii]
MRLQSLRIGSDFKRKLVTHQALLAQVESVFKKVVNLELETGELVSISTINSNAPNNLVLESSQMLDLTSFGIKPREEVKLTPKVIKFKRKRFQIEVDGSKTWDGNLKFDSFIENISKFKENLQFFIEILSREGETAGVGEIGALLPQVIVPEEMNQQKLNKSLNPVSRKAFPIITNLIQATLDNNKEQIIKSSQDLIGLGPGLTPAGDDFLVGFYTMLQIIEARINIDYIDLELKNRLLDAAESRTTLVSKSTLKYILEGKVSEVILSLINALFLGGDEEVFCSTLQLLSRGSTSGTDIATGILTGGYILLNMLDGNYK